MKTEVQRVREDANHKCYTTIHFLNAYQIIFYFNHYYPHTLIILNVYYSSFMFCVDCTDIR